MEYEENSRIRSIWERFLDYELGHLRFVADLLEKTEKRDAAEVLAGSLPEPIEYKSHREFVRQTLRNEVNLSALGTEIVDRSQERKATRTYRDQMNAEGSPSETVATGYMWQPGTELAATYQGSVSARSG